MNLESVNPVEAPIENIYEVWPQIWPELWPLHRLTVFECWQCLTYQVAPVGVTLTLAEISDVNPWPWP